MKKRTLFTGITILLAAAMLVACNDEGELEKNHEIIDLNTINSGKDASEVAGDDTWATGANNTYSAHSDKGGQVITFAFLQEGEAKDQIASSLYYFDRMNTRNAEYRLKKSGATSDELKTFAQDQCTEFEDQEISELIHCMDRIQGRFDEIGYTYPISKPVFFAKTTMLEEGGEYLCYARDNCIYVSDAFISSFDYSNPSDQENFDYLMTKELFHILVLNDPAFKDNMDRIFGFTMCQEPMFSDDAADSIYMLPNAGDYDAYAEFDVKGTKKKCVVVPYVPAYSDGANVLDQMQTGLVDIENPSKIIPLEDVTNFYLVMGNNSGYVNAIEECAADNFAMAVTYQKEILYSTPEIIDEILKYLKTGAATETVTGTFRFTGTVTLDD